MKGERGRGEMEGEREGRDGRSELRAAVGVREEGRERERGRKGRRGEI